MNQQSLVTVLFVVIIGATAYFWFQGAGGQTAPEASPSVVALEARLAELRHLKEIRFDTSVLQDKFFQSLTGPIIPPLPDIKIGRSNPFIPF